MAALVARTAALAIVPSNYKLDRDLTPTARTLLDCAVASADAPLS